MGFGKSGKSGVLPWMKWQLRLGAKSASYKRTDWFSETLDDAFIGKRNAQQIQKITTLRELTGRRTALYITNHLQTRNLLAIQLVST
ncbi:MAG: hypothetical protein EBT20_19255 [Alphaproteobacteria bacterium]|nr:hypothetical protein [Alphaproteobacteria bacterium]